MRFQHILSAATVVLLLSTPILAATAWAERLIRVALFELPGKDSKEQTQAEKRCLPESAGFRCSRVTP